MGSRISITSPGVKPQECLKVNNFVAWHREWNRTLGIWELDRELKFLQRRLAEVQGRIIDGSTVKTDDLM